MVLSRKLAAPLEEFPKSILLMVECVVCGRTVEKAQEVQTVVFSKEDGDWTEGKAKKWLDDHDFKNDKVDETDATWRFRQFSPSDCQEGSFQSLTENVPAGVTLVSCEKSKAAEASTVKYKSWPSVVRNIDKRLRQIEFIVSTDTRDRAGDIVRADGWELDNYRKNPVFLWAHDYTRPPIGRAIEIEAIAAPKRASGSSGVLRAVDEFADTEFALEIFDLYSDKILNAVSAGFDPIEWQAMFEENDRFVGIEYTRQELLEHSGVPVPMNPETLQRAIQKGMINHTAQYFDDRLDAAKRAVSDREDLASVAEKLNETQELLRRM